MKKKSSDVLSIKKILKKKVSEAKKSEVRKATSCEAIDFHLRNRFSERQYKNIRLFSKSHGADIYPTYNFLIAMKNQCYPEDIFVNEFEASVSLQNMFNHTTKRMYEFLKSEIVTKMNVSHDDWEFEYMYGMDGSSGFSHHNLEMNHNQQTDQHVFAVSCVPLRIKSSCYGIIWENPSPSSVRFCRPLHIMFAKETTELTLKLHHDLKAEIENLEPLTFNLYDGSEQSISVEGRFTLCMIDGKTMVAVSGARSVQSCPICDQTPSELCKRENWGSEKFAPKPGRLVFGISPLHLYIRLFEALLHIGYLNVLKKSRSSQLPQVMENKKIVKEKFKNLMFLTVDSVTPQGGSTNNGNTARKAFGNVDLFAECLGLNENEKVIIVMLRNILLAVSSQLPINSEKFYNYCYHIYNKYFELFAWQPMTPTLHKVLVHGAEIINASPFPLGVLTEESAESRNKFMKHDRKYHARLSNRVDNLTDIFHNALQLSDPYFSCKHHSTQKSKRKRSLPQEVIDLLDLDEHDLNNIQIISEQENITDYNDEIQEYCDEEFLDECFLESEF